MLAFRSRLAVAALGGCAIILAGTMARGQGIIVDRRPIVPVGRSYEIREIGIDARIRDQVAEVQISQTFHNPGSFPLEAEFLFPLPDDGAVQSFLLLVDGKELPGKLMGKDEARRIYEEIVRTKRDPALLEYMGRGLFKTSVFPIPPGADRKVTMRYTQLCRRDRDVIEFSYPLGTQKFATRPVQRLAIGVNLESRDAIKSIYCPTDDARIDRSGDHSASVRLERRDVSLSNDFRLIYTLAEGTVGGSILSYKPSTGEDGFFLLLASPRVAQPETRPQPKTVIFVLDRSGSMAGKKIEQARNALKVVLNSLRDEDLFNIVVYDDRVESFRPELERFSSRTREEATRFVDNIREGGSTNIDGALKSALALVRDDARPGYVLFLTDGLPTAGETQELRIAEHCREANPTRARIFCFGVGFDVNARLLDRLSGGNGGTSEYVKPDEDIESHVARFSSRMTSPVLASIRIDLEGIDVNRSYPRDIPDLFEGGQIVWVGRYRQPGRTTIKVTGKVGAERKSFEFPADLAGSSRGSSHDYIERLWAVRRVGYLIDQIDLSGQNRELIDELVGLSTRYGILTPYTSFLADERVQLHASASNAAQARESLRALETVSGAEGVVQRDAKQSYMKADRPGLSYGMAGDSMAAGMSGMQRRGIVRFGEQAAKAQSAPLAAKPAGGVVLRRGGASAGGRLLSEAEARKDATVRQVGAKTFYFKNDRWIDSEVKPEDEAKARTVRQFSEPYFELARGQSAEFNQYLAFTEPVTVKLGDATYRIEPASDGR